MALQKRTTNYDVKTVREALNILDEAANESSDEIKKMLTKDYRTFRQTLKDASPRVRGALNDLTKEPLEIARIKAKHAYQVSKDTAKDIDHSVHKNAWSYLGGTAFTAGILGYFLGRKK